MDAKIWAKEIMSRSGDTMLERVALSPLTGLGKLYGMAGSMRRRAYGIGLKKCARAGVPVISVGNVALGGTGKTPCVQGIAERLLEKGMRPAILSRGYGGENRERVLVVSDGERILSDPRMAGDEPVFLAAKLHGAVVVVGSDRRLTARYAVDKLGADVIVLDDGFQHMKLCRDLNVVTIDGRNPFGNGNCLPRGYLREPLTSLSEADIVVLTRTGGMKPDSLDRLKNRIKAHNPSVGIFAASHSPSGVVTIGEQGARPVTSLKGMKVLAFAGIGEPEGFFRSLSELGCVVLDGVTFPDHHGYVEEDLARLEGWAKMMNAQALVTTEKDMVKVAELDEVSVPVMALAIRMDYGDRTDEFFEMVEDAVRRLTFGERKGSK